MKTPIRFLIAMAAASWLSLVWADDKALAVSIERASQQLGTKEWRQADKELREASQSLGESTNKDLRAQFLFYSALTNQQRSDDPTVDASDRQAARARAITDYESYLKLKPTSGGAINNLAQLYAQEPERRPRALQLYDRAVALKGPRVGAYRLNKAALLVEMGQSSQALQVSLDALNADARNPAAQSLALGLVQKTGSTAQIADYVRQLNHLGLVDRSIETAIAQIEGLKASREPILVALTESLANSTITDLPEKFPVSEAARRLSKHLKDGELAGGIRELFMLFQQPGNPKTFGWWRQDADESEEYRPKTRAAAMLGLARALGDRCRRAGKDHYDCAEKYYRFAIDFSGATADPEAFLSLAQILIASGRKDELANVSKQYEQALFRGKMTAYGRENKPKIFRFHLALGMMYAYLGKWSDPQWEPAGAVFQLQHALNVAKEYNQPGHDEQLQMPPEAVALLSDGYAKLGNADSSARVRVEAAEASLAAGDKQGAADLLGKEWREALPPTIDAALLSRVDAARARADSN